MFTNNFHKSLKSLLTLIYLMFMIFNISAQNTNNGLPLITNIAPRDYGYESQNYTITQNKDGIIYIGNLSGVVEYDGNFWNLINVKGTPILHTNPKGNVFVGLFNDFGILKNNAQNKLSFQSLFENVEKKDFGNTYKVESLGDDVFFCSLKYLYKYSTKTNKSKLILEHNPRIKIFKANNTLYVFKKEKGLFYYDNEKFIPTKNANFFKNLNIIDIISHGKNEILVKTENEFYLITDKEIKIFKTDADEFLIKNDYAKGLLLSNNTYAFASKLNGIVFCDFNGKLLFAVSKKNGLYNNRVNNLFVDSSNNLWVALDNGISIIEYPSNLSFFNETNGLKGGVYSVRNFENNLYVATSNGVFKHIASKLSSESECKLNDNFVQLNESNFEAYNFYEINKNLYVTSNKGLIKVSEHKCEFLIDGKLKSMLHCKSDSSLLILVMENGLFVVKIDENGKWSDKLPVKNFDKYVRTIAEDKNGNIWLGSDFDGLYELNLNTSEIKSYDSKDGLPKEFDWIDVYNINHEIIFSTSQGLYHFDEKTRKFYIDSSFGINFLKENSWVYPLVEDKNNNVWLSLGTHSKFVKQTGFAKFNPQTRKYTIDFSKLGKLSYFTVETIFLDKKDVIWFGGFDGLFRFDSEIKTHNENKFKTLIRKITIEHDSIISASIDENIIDKVVYKSDSLIPEISYKYNSIRFEFSCPKFASESKVLHRYMLEGYDSEWSEWKTINHKEYTNLPEGIYKFKVESKDIHGNISIETSYEFEIDPPIYRTWLAYIIYVILLITFFIAIIRWRSYLYEKETNKLDKIIAEKTEDLVMQKERAEQLVSNILPKQTVEELKSMGRSSRKKYKMVTVLFSDIQGFTKIADLMNPDELLDELDKYFLNFDSIVESLGIEKIKTIGDAYMCAGGIPQKNRTNPVDVVYAALTVQKYMKDLKDKQLDVWDIRIGIHTGAVIAGVVGSKKYTYDIWGDTVNVASRMESLGQPQEVNISEVTYDLVKEYFDCEYRGKVPVKYKGEMKMYFVRGFKPEFSENGDGATPNQLFKTKLQIVRFDDLDELIMTKLEKGLLKTLYYHDLKHTIDVCTQVEILGRLENVSEDEMLLLKTAALFHDIGFIIGYDDHEFLSIKMAREILPQFQYSTEQIKIIGDLIYVTKLPPEPKTLLEQIMCDADLDYLGRADFIPVSQKLFRELFERKKIKSVEEWNKIQIDFISNHQYFTESARKLRNVNKQEQLAKLKKLL